MIKLYGSALSRGAAVMVALEMLDIPYEVEEMLPRSANTQSPEYLALNPTGRVPTLVDGEVVIFETQAILYYLVRQYGKGQLWAETPAAEATIWQWTLFISNQLEAPALEMLIKVKFPNLSSEAKRSAAVEQLSLFLPILDARLATQTYLGDEMSFADIHGALVLSWLKLAKFDLAPFPHVQHWLNTMLSTEAYQNVTARMRRG